ncbi:trace amine-associated receptor 13c-like [Gouania willdenowi]|uniref:trace amine-associated receptor 13c-like n=1 Tax=Gouania willdenowi TaxID=441366 RepID=UPI001056876C|nr:trace amine-associated receptor 13c-like [Gouania willdenowi]
MSTPDEAELCYPHLGNSSCRRIMRSHSVSVLIHIILSSISVLTLTLNLLVIITISHFKKLHTPTNFLLLSLAVSDFSVGFLWIFQILLLDGCWVLSAGWCVFNAVVIGIVTSASIGTVVLISVDRYVAVCDPMHYSTKVTPNRTKAGIVLCWLCSGIFYTAVLKDNIEHPGRFNSCAGDCTVYFPFIGGIVNLFLDFIFPVTIIVVLYVRVFVVAVSQAQAMRSHVRVVTFQVSQKVNRSELKAARVLGVVVVVFLICLTPFFIAAFSTGFSDISLTSFAFVFCLVLFNSLLNPVIYVFLYPWFRKSVKCILSLQILKSGSSEANIL